MVEMVITMTILAVLSIFLASFITTGVRSFLFIKLRGSALSQARTSTERMVREMRRINRPSSIVSAQATAFEFTTTASEQIKFWQSATDLKRNSDIMATDLVTPEGLRFNYYDANKTVTAVTNSIRYITVKLQIRSGTTIVTLEDSARIRNL
jgi:hypothetical protein